MVRVNVDIPDELRIRFNRGIANSPRFRGGLKSSLKIAFAETIKT